MNTERNARKNEALEEDERFALDDEDKLMYDDLKRIMKELLFNGARRDIVGKFEVSNTGPAGRESTMS
jgi:hypothetical protein